MPSQVFKVGSKDFTAYLKVDGLRWSRNDIDAPDSGRDMNGRMRRKRVAVKAKLQLSCRPLAHAEMLALNAALDRETVEVTYLDPLRGVRTGTFYGSSVDATTSYTSGGETVWTGATFNLIEV